MQLDAVLRGQMGRPPGYSPGLVSRLSGVPKATIVNWLEGRVTRPRRWQDLVRVADAMRLDKDATDDLLAAGHHSSIDELASAADDGDRALLGTWLSAGRTSPPAAAPLPIVATPFLGRAAERAVVGGLVSEADVRVVTLTGVAGAGKTRLAIEVARDVAEFFRDGVAYVALAPLTDAELVPDLVAQALGVTGGRDGIGAELAARHQLVVLDNFEHVLAALPAVAELIAVAPDLTFLVTSRAVLHLYGEHQFEVAPLPIPDESETSFDTIADSPAVALFAQRARAVDPSFGLDAGNVGVVAEICRRLDGLPLAIELAAARTTVLGAEGLLVRLATSLGLLTWGARDLPGRHQSLQATLDWSLAQVDDPARRLFAQLSVFMAGSRLDGAEAVGGPLDSHEVLDALMELVDHSLLRTVTVHDETRFVMLETVRSYAASLLTDEESDLRHRYALHYVVEVARAVGREAQGARLRQCLDRADEELDNIRALLRWSLDHDDTNAAGQIAASLLPYWLGRDALAEGERWIDLTLGDAQRLSSEVLAATLYAGGRIAHQRGDLVRAEQHFRQSLVVFDRLGDDVGRARAVVGLGSVSSRAGTPSPAR